MLETLEKIAKNAGEIIIDHYYKTESKVNNKSDGSPVTVADLESEDFIVSQLKQNFSFPIVTEESPVVYENRKNWIQYWLVDPLDGTKDFIKKNDEFTVNIALIDGHQSVAGVVYAPALDLMYTASLNEGAKKNGKLIYNESKRKNLIAADSRQHSTKETEKFMLKNKISKILRIGSSLKLCSLAEGLIDVYPRFNGTKEWDTAAAHIICKEAGCKIVDIETENELLYNKDSIKNNFFIASRNDLSFL
tara:strand:+ start:462 stop:1205 length:744 start_codon:yes stop_codon:yes gene_type:complete